MEGARAGKWVRAGPCGVLQRVVGSLGDLRAGERPVWILVWRSCLWLWAVRGAGRWQVMVETWAGVGSVASARTEETGLCGELRGWHPAGVTQDPEIQLAWPFRKDN